MHAPLTHWLRLLWGTAPPLAFDSDRAYLAGGAIHLPPRADWRQHSAAAAHAAAHLVYSPKCFDGTGLGPIARVLLALLEDARVEALAVREFPGLARLWRPLHTASPETGVGFEGLATRLARALRDPAYDDPDPWVRKGRDLCFLDPAFAIPALRSPAELRVAATRLGHDIGQSRWPYHGNSPLPLPSYRDDHRWMWAADVLASAPPHPVAAATHDAADEPSPDAALHTAEHPEWDRLIARLRPAWCRVVEVASAPAPAAPIAEAARAAARRLLAPVDDLQRRRTRPTCSDTGESFDLDALVRWQVGQRLRLPVEHRVYRGARAVPSRTRLWLLIDQSASTAAAHGAHAGDALRSASQAATALALALRARGIVFGIAAFCSNGRRAVHWRTLKAFDQPVDDALAGRLQTLRPHGSTRLGAVLRHATERSCREQGVQHWVLVLSDGRPHDIDIHDPDYLVEDARRAVCSAARRGVRVGCLVFDQDAGRRAAQVFGRRTVPLGDLAELPAALRRLLD